LTTTQVGDPTVPLHFGVHLRVSQCLCWLAEGKIVAGTISEVIALQPNKGKLAALQNYNRQKLPRVSSCLVQLVWDPNYFSPSLPCGHSFPWWVSGTWDRKTECPEGINTEMEPSTRLLDSLSLSLALSLYLPFSLSLPFSSFQRTHNRNDGWGRYWRIRDNEFDEMEREKRLLYWKTNKLAAAIGINDIGLTLLLHSRIGACSRVHSTYNEMCCMCGRYYCCGGWLYMAAPS
jgi:hypothetical protein